MDPGAEWLVDAHGCDAERLRDSVLLRRLCDAVLSELELKLAAPAQWHQFPSPGGVTGLYLLTESHLACHTYPELGLCAFSLYCCRERAEFPWEVRLRAALAAERVSVRRMVRGAGACSISEGRR